MSHRIWVLDDDAGIRYVLEEYLHAEGMAPRCFEDGASLRHALKTDDSPDLVIADIQLDGESGLDIMQSIRRDRPTLPVIIMTAYSDLQSAVGAFQGGAFEFLAKPFDLNEVGQLIDKALRAQQTTTVQDPHEPGLIGQSPAFQSLIRMMGRLSGSDIPVMIQGETGSGKELVARALHRHSPRSKGPFVAINTAAIPEDLLESELFGHERGAFTGANERRIGRFEQAAGGTLFLDEIGDMPLALQTRLLRVLAEGEFYRLGGRDLIQARARIVTATHHDLNQLVEEGQFRADLYHRLKVIALTVPPLRARREDIPELVKVFLHDAAKAFSLPSKTPDGRLIEHLQRLPWPGNVRELRHVCQSLAALAPGQVVSTDDLPTEYRQPMTEAAGSNQTSMRSTSNDVTNWTAPLAAAVSAELRRDQGLRFHDFKAAFQKEVCLAALSLCQGNQSEAARRLGISRNTLAAALATRSDGDAATA